MPSWLSTHGTSTARNLGMSAQRSQLVQHYQDLADRLRAEVRLHSDEGPIDGAGAPTVSEVEGYMNDTDLRQPAFRIGMNTYPGAE
jgi:hypothetical protein